MATGMHKQQKILWAIPATFCSIPLFLRGSQFEQLFIDIMATRINNDSEVPLHSRSTTDCAARGGSPVLLTEQEIAELLQQVGENWSVATTATSKGTQVQCLRLQLTMKNFLSVGLSM